MVFNLLIYSMVHRIICYFNGKKCLNSGHWFFNCQSPLCGVFENLKYFIIDYLALSSNHSSKVISISVIVIRVISIIVTISAIKDCVIVSTIKDCVI